MSMFIIASCPCKDPQCTAVAATSNDTVVIVNAHTLAESTGRAAAIVAAIRALDNIEKGVAQAAGRTN